MKLLNKIILAITLSTSTFGFSQAKKEIEIVSPHQTIKLINQIGGEGKEKSQGITSNGFELFTVGVFSKTLTVNTISLDEMEENKIETPLTLNAKGVKDGIVAKYNEEKELVWVTQLSATSYLNAQVIAVNNGNWVYVAGTFKGDFTYLSDGDERTLTSKGQDGDAFILQMNSKGNIDWVRQFGGTESTLQFKGLKIGSDNSIYLTGNFSGKTNFNTSKNWAEKQPKLLTSGGTEVPSTNGFVLKLNYAAEFQWVKQISSNFDSYTTSMEVDNDNNIYVSGTFQESAKFSDDNELPVVAGLDSYIAKYNSNGELLWANSFGAIGEEKITSISLNNDNKIVACGNFKTEVDEEEEEESPESAFLGMKSNGTSDGFIFCLDLEGKIEWKKQIKNDLNIFLQAIEIYDNNDMLVAAYIKNEFNRSLYAVKLNSTGKLLNETTLKGTYINAKGISIFDDNSAFILGHFKEKITLQDKTYSSKGRTDLFLIELK